MKVVAKTAGGYIVSGTLEELNSFTGLANDKYNFGDTLTVDPNIALAGDIAAADTAFMAKVDKMKLAIEDIENG